MMTLLLGKGRVAKSDAQQSANDEATQGLHGATARGRLPDRTGESIESGRVHSWTP
jgi:hypothetical protein